MNKIKFMAKPVNNPKGQKNTNTNNSGPVKVEQKWYIKWFFLLFWILFVIFLTLFLQSFLLYSLYTKWWKKNGGKEYSKVFSISLMAQFENFKLGYSVYSQFLPVEASFQSIGQAKFIQDMMMAYAFLDPDSDDPNLYFLLPVHLCESIIVGEIPAIERNKLYPGDQKQYYYDDKTGWPLDISTWKQVLYQWGARDAKGQGVEVKWNETYTSNFLYHKYHFPVQSPFIVSFLTQSASDMGGQKWYPNCFATAVGLNYVTGTEVGYNGGLVGMVKYGFGEEDVSYATIVQYIFSQTEIQVNRNNKCSASKWGLSALGSGSSGVASTLTAFAFLGGELNPFIGLGIFVVTSLSSFSQTIQSCT